MCRLGAIWNVCGQHCARHGSKARWHYRVDLRCREILQNQVNGSVRMDEGRLHTSTGHQTYLDIWPYKQRRLSHTQKDIAGRGNALAHSRTEHRLQNPAQFLHRPLHGAPVIQNRYDKAEEVDHRQHLSTRKKPNKSFACKVIHISSLTRSIVYISCRCQVLTANANTPSDFTRKSPNTKLLPCCA